MIKSIEQAMGTLKLGGIAKDWRSTSYENTEQYASELLRLELKEREANRINRMVKTAGFRVIKTLDDFVWNGGIELPLGLTREYMAALSFLPGKENLIFIGSVGTGKTHLAAELLFRVISDRCERKSLIITSNLEFSQWFRKWLRHPWLPASCMLFGSQAEHGQALSLLNNAEFGRLSNKKMMFKAALNPDLLLKILSCASS